MSCPSRQIAILLLAGVSMQGIAQEKVNVVNKGTLIYIQQGISVTIDGDYIDGSGSDDFGQSPHESSMTLDAPMFLSGTLALTGNIVNNSSTGTKLIYEFENPTHTGRVVLNGTGEQRIGGSVNSYFPNLELAKTAGTVAVLDRQIKVDNAVIMTQGNLNLNTQKLELGGHGSIAGESETRRIYGASGYMEIPNPAINPSEDIPNFKGFGVGYVTGATQNFAGVGWQRIHGVSGYAVADGVTALRVFRMTTSSSGTFPTVRFHYHNAELGTLASSESTLAVYYSNDNGVSWTKASTTVDVGTNIATATGVQVAANVNNFFVLAADDCTGANLPDVTITSAGPAINSGAMDICDTEAFLISVPEVASNDYAWSTPHGTATTYNYPIASIAYPSHTGSYQVFVRNVRGCEAVNAITVNVRAIPIASMSISPDPNTTALCFGNEIAFSDESTVAGTSVVDTWDWDFGDAAPGDESDEQDPVFTYTTTGVKTPSLRVTTNHGCVSTPATETITIDALPVPAFRITDGLSVSAITERCEDLDVRFLNQSRYRDHAGDSTSALSYQWTFGDGNLSTAQHPTHQYLTHGSFTITLRTTADATLCYDEQTQFITIDPEPVPAFTTLIDGSSIDEACEGVYIDFVNGSTMPDGTEMTYAWDFGDGESSTETDPLKEFIDPQTYDVVLTVTSVTHGCSENVNLLLPIHPAPKGTFSVVDADICHDEAVALVNNSEIASGTFENEWNFGDGSTLTDNNENLSHSYGAPRQYKITLTRTSDEGCTNNVDQTVTVHPDPVASFVGLNACEGKEVVFYNNSDIQSGSITGYAWNFPDGTTSTDDAPTHAFATFGSKTISLTATSSFGCDNTFTGTVEVYRNPSFNLGASITGCDIPFTIDPAADGTAFLPAGSTYQWQDNLSQTIGSGEELVIGTSGVYYVTIVTPAPQFCSTTQALPVFLFMPANLGEDIHSCSSITLDAEANLPGEKARAEETHYAWTKDGSPVGSSQTLNAVESGLYALSLTRVVAGKACTSVDEVYVEIDLPLAVSLPAQQTICEGESVTLDAGVTADAYTWTRLNSGEQFAGQTLVVTEPGDYRLEVVNGGCSAFITTSVIVSPGPSVSFATSSLTGCAGSPLTFSDHSYATVGSISSRLWDFGDLTSETDVATVAKTFTTPGEYTVTLTVSTDNGCSNTFSRQVVIKQTPLADFSIAPVCQEALVAITNNSTPGASLSWDFGDGSMSTEETPIKAFAEDGTFTVTLNAESNGCFATATATAIVHPKPRIGLGEEVTTCGASVLLDAFNPGSTFRWFDPVNGNATLGTAQQYLVSTDMQIGVDVTNPSGCSISEITSVVLNSPLTVDLGADRAICDEVVLDAGYFPGGSYLWNTGATTRELLVTTSGTYNVTVTDQNGCPTNASVNITVGTTPSVAALPASISVCSGTTTTVDAGFNPLYDYQWSTGETASSIIVSSAGSYSVTVSNETCSVHESVSINILDSPIASFSAEDACEEAHIVFGNNSDPISDVQYLWDFGDGSSSTVFQPSKQFGSPGSYNVSLTVTAANGCSDVVVQAIDVYEVPVASFTVADACTFATLSIANLTAGSNNSYVWDFGNGQASHDETPAYAYPAAGTYLLNLLVTNERGCTDNFLQAVAIGETPSLASWDPEVVTCNSSVVLDAGNDGASYVWNDSSTDRELTISTGGTYTVTITSPDGCSTTGNADVVFNTPAFPQLADETEDCGSVLLDPVASAATYLWSTGAQTKTIVAEVSGDYTIQLITSELCISHDATTVTVNEIPVIDLGPTVEACDGETVNIGTSASVPSDYMWNTGAAGTILPVTTSGMYTVELTTPESCTYSDSVEVIFHELPADVLDNEIEACGSVVLDAGNAGSTFLWSSGSSDQSITAAESGTYTVTIVNSHQCTVEVSSVVSILPLPSFSLGSDVTICHGGTTVLDPGDIGGDYVWTTNETQRSITVGANGVYALTVTNEFGCAYADEVQVTVRPPLALDLGPDRLLCDNAGQFLSAGIDNVSYAWGSDIGLESDEKIIQVLRTGTYWVEIVDGFSCTARDTVTVSPTTENITASFLVPSSVGRGDVVHFAQLSEPDPSSFFWTFGDGGLSTQENPTHRYFQTGDFIATLVVSNGVCSDTLSKTITVRDGRDLAPQVIKLPELIDFSSAASYPNPTRGPVKVEVEMTSETEVSVAIYSLSGVAMDERRKVILKEVFEFDLSDRSDGVYVVRLIAGKKVRILKLLKSGGYQP